PLSFWSEKIKGMNAVKTALLLALMSAILLIGGEALGGRTGFMYGLVLAIAPNVFSYFFSDRLALAMDSAQPVGPERTRQVSAHMHLLAKAPPQKVGLPMPKLWVIPNDSPNAFATGRNPNHASVSFTEGILRTMNDRELEGVIAHELGHVKHRDILI